MKRLLSYISAAIFLGVLLSNYAFAAPEIGMSWGKIAKTYYFFGGLGAFFIFRLLTSLLGWRLGALAKNEGVASKLLCLAITLDACLGIAATQLSANFQDYQGLPQGLTILLYMLCALVVGLILAILLAVFKPTPNGVS